MKCLQGNRLHKSKVLLLNSKFSPWDWRDMTDLGWEQSQLHEQEVPIKSEAMMRRLWVIKETLKPLRPVCHHRPRGSVAIPPRKQPDHLLPVTGSSLPPRRPRLLPLALSFEPISPCLSHSRTNLTFVPQGSP
jgi:hypothetical protein